MKRYAVFDITTGMILRIVQCHHSIASLQASDGQGIIEVMPDVRDDTHEIIDGVAVLKSV